MSYDALGGDGGRDSDGGDGGGGGSGGGGFGIDRVEAMTLVSHYYS